MQIDISYKFFFNCIIKCDTILLNFTNRISTFIITNRKYNRISFNYFWNSTVGIDKFIWSFIYIGCWNADKCFVHYFILFYSSESLSCKLEVYYCIFTKNLTWMQQIKKYWAVMRINKMNIINCFCQLITIYFILYIKDYLLSNFNIRNGCIFIYLKEMLICNCIVELCFISSWIVVCKPCILISIIVWIYLYSRNKIICIGIIQMQQVCIIFLLLIIKIISSQIIYLTLHLKE